MTLHGPADASHYRVKVGRYGDRWYTDPLPADTIADTSDWQGPSVSATKPPFANKYVPMRGIADMTDDMWAQLSTLTPDGRYERIKTHDKTVGRTNMDRGAIVHLWAEDLVAGRPMRDPIGYDPAAIAQAEQFKPALVAFFDTYQPVPLAVEAVCLHRTLNGVGYGGTADLFALIDGATWVVDWKSRNSDHGAYLEEGAQGGAYLGAQYMIVEDNGDPVRALIPDCAGVLIVSITRDGFRCYPIDRDGAIDAYHSMHAWWHAQQTFRKNKVIGRPWAPRAAAANIPPAPADRENLRARILELIDAGHEDTVRAVWPAGIPALSQDGHTDDQLVAILAAVRKAETAVGAGWHPDDRAPQPEPVATPTKPVTRTPDDSILVDDATLDTLKETFGELTDAELAGIRQVAGEAAAAGRSISVQQTPSVRRWSIARALIWWAQTGANYEELFTAAAQVATPEQTNDSDVSAGGLLGSFTTEQADQLADKFTTNK